MKKSFFYQSLDPVQKPKGFWHFQRADFYCILAMFIGILFTFFTTGFTGQFNSILRYWDGPNYLYVSMTKYNIPRTNPWTKYYKMDPSYFACHLPGYPFVIYVCSKVCLPLKLFGFNNWIFGFYLSIFVSSFLYVYAFRRLLIIYSAVQNPTLSTILSSFIPLRMLIYHSVGASETLFMFFLSMTLINYKINNIIAMLIFVWCCCYTRIEGMAVGATIGFCYLIRFKILKAFLMFLTFLAPLSLIILHKYKFNDPLAYLHYNQNSQGLIGKPFHELINIQYNDLYTNSFVSFFIFIFIGHVFVYTKSIPIGIFSTIYLFYISCLNHIDIYRYSIPCSLFAIFIGFDPIFSQRQTIKALIILSPIYFIFAFIYVKGQIHSNVAVPFFYRELFTSINYY